MGRFAEWVVIVAVILLVFSLMARFVSPSSLGIGIRWGGKGYVLPPQSISLGLATLLCFFAAVYSLGMPPLNRTATRLHFWLTTVGISVFWLAFCRVPNSRTAIWVVFSAPAAVLLSQAIFVWNLVQAILRMPQSRS